MRRRKRLKLGLLLGLLTAAVIAVPSALAKTSGPAVLDTTTTVWCANYGDYCYGGGVAATFDGKQTSYGGMYCNHNGGILICTFLSYSKSGRINSVNWENRIVVPEDLGSGPSGGHTDSGWTFQLTGVTDYECNQNVTLNTNSGTEQFVNRGYLSDAQANEIISTKGAYTPSPSCAADLITSAGGSSSGTTTSTTTTPSPDSPPGVRITREIVNRKLLISIFSFADTGAAATAGTQCDLRSVIHGKESALIWKSCKSGVRYSGLVRNRVYVFEVRAGNASGFGRPASRKLIA
jgi:hypothetical protein